MLVNEKVSKFVNSIPCVELMNGAKNKVRRTNKIGTNFADLIYSPHSLSKNIISFKATPDFSAARKG